jgi:hypothetical protein
MKRGTFTEQELALIDTGELSIGQRPIAVICTRGMPANVTKSISSSGTRMQYLYEGIIVSFSNEGLVDHISQQH